MLLMVLSSCSRISEFQLQPEFNIYIKDRNSQALNLAVEILQRDIKAVLGKEAKIVSGPINNLDLNHSLIIVNDANSELKIRALQGFERHRIYTQKKNIVLHGADIRGTIYAIYTFSEKFLGINPLWHWTGQIPSPKGSIHVANDFVYDSGEPYVKYRCWSPYELGLNASIDSGSKLQESILLETMLRLKINCVELNSCEDCPDMNALSARMNRIHESGLKITGGQCISLNTSSNNWGNYWREIRNTCPKKLLLSNTNELEEFWRYIVRRQVKKGIDPIWVLNYQGEGNISFWEKFEDAPETKESKIEVMNNLIKMQVNLLQEETGQQNPLMRLVLSEEMLALLAEGLVQAPVDATLIYPLVPPQKAQTGNSPNLRFSEAEVFGVQPEGPWEMEKRFRQMDAVNEAPLYFSSAVTKNFREQVLALSAHAEMLWNYRNYCSDSFVRSFCASSYGDLHAISISKLYKQYYGAYWRGTSYGQISGAEEEYQGEQIFYILNYKQTIEQLSEIFFEPLDSSGENLRSALLKGTEESYRNFRLVAWEADSLIQHLDSEKRVFFKDNLLSVSRYMMYLNESLHYYCQAYQSRNVLKQEENLRLALYAAMNAREHVFDSGNHAYIAWYAEEGNFDIDGLVSRIDKTLKLQMNNYGHTN